MTDPVGELFMVGFQGPTLPRWVERFEREFGLGSVILFDYSCQARSYGNNIQSKEQLKELCQAVGELGSKPFVALDQEGGKVRRLKESLGFAPLPSARRFSRLSLEERRALLMASFTELKGLGIHYNLAPVIDLNVNPANPDIGGAERSFSAHASEVAENAHLVNQVAKKVGLGLCLKHYPGLGGATTNSHDELTDLSGTITQEQLELFYGLAPGLSGEAICVSHGIVGEWDRENPVSMSARALGDLRGRLPDTLFLSDDLQMQGLQRKFTTEQSVLRGIHVGLDMFCVGNNMMDEQERIFPIAERLCELLSRDEIARRNFTQAVARVQIRKEMFSEGLGFT